MLLDGLDLAKVRATLTTLGLDGWLLFDFPLLQLWAQRPVWVFVLWAVVIALLAWVMERDDGSGHG